MDQLDQGNTGSMVKLTPDDGAAERETQQFLPVVLVDQFSPGMEKDTIKILHRARERARCMKQWMSNNGCPMSRVDVDSCRVRTTILICKVQGSSALDPPHSSSSYIQYRNCLVSSDDPWIQISPDRFSLQNTLLGARGHVLPADPSCLYPSHNHVPVSPPKKSNNPTNDPQNSGLQSDHSTHAVSFLKTSSMDNCQDRELRPRTSSRPTAMGRRS